MSNEPIIQPTPRTLSIPDFSLVLLIGVSGSGKSTFASRHFLPTEVLSSDRFRGWVSDDENSLEATNDAFDALHYMANVRLRRRKLTVIDATNVQADSRKSLLKIAADHDALAVAIVLDVPERLCHDRNASRPDRDFGPHVVRNQSRQLRQSLRKLRLEGFRYIHVLEGPEQIDASQITRTPLWTDKRTETGPFDIIGDLHGCYDELVELLGKLGYAQTRTGERESGRAGEEAVSTLSTRNSELSTEDSQLSILNSQLTWRHPEGRKAIFLGDLVDRGPKVVETAQLVMEMVKSGNAIVVPGNHDIKLMRCLQGKKVTISHGLQESIDQIEKLSIDNLTSDLDDRSPIGENPKSDFSASFASFVDSLVSHYVLDDGDLVVAHAGMKEAYQNRSSRRVRDFAIWGDTTGETDEFGLPVRYPWAEDYRGRAMVVYGHTPVPEAEWLNNTINIDTGCVFGGKLTALRYPEREIISVSARKVYAEPAKPFLVEQSTIDNLQLSIVNSTLQQQSDDLLDAADVLGKRIISTRHAGNVMVRAENSAAALEVMSRFAVEPRWLIYLPPTMSPSETSHEPGFLEYPTEAFEYFKSQGVNSVVCQTKHMGSRAIVVVCRNEAAAAKRFGVAPSHPSYPSNTSDSAIQTQPPTPDPQHPVLGECFTRTGRRFFDNETVHRGFLAEVAGSMERAGLWHELETDWVCLDCELMPWNAKAQALLRDQYAPVGAAAKIALSASLHAVQQTEPRGMSVTDLTESLHSRLQDAHRFTSAYANYCWDTNGLEGVKLAPFHLLASEGKTYLDRSHEWHVQNLARLSEHSPLFMPTESRTVDLTDDASQNAATEWWREYTESGGEGMVVKPLDFIARGPKGLIQPAVKVRGREYLRIIYGPEYTEPHNLERLRKRSLHAKRALAAKEFALGAEALERFVRREPLRNIHECAFAILALESEPVDPRL